MALLSCPAFAQDPCTSSPTGSTTLTWTPPTQNTDGTPLTDLSGYKIYWGTTDGSWPNTVTLNNASLTSYVVDSLAPATWYFTATAFNSSGVESMMSNTATKTITGPTATLCSKASTFAYVLFLTLNQMTLVPIGTVPTPVPCNPLVSASDVEHGMMYLIPKSAVAFEGDAENDTIFAPCE